LIANVDLALRFPVGQIEYWASEYSYLDEETSHIERVIGPRCRAAGYIGQADFLFICKWKSLRQKGRYGRNSASVIEEASGIALGASDERLRIGVLRILEGVGWPTASTLLHFAHPEPYPILDFRALWSLGVEVSPTHYDFATWWDYVTTCRRIAESAGTSIRDLDRALWQYSKKNQRIEVEGDRG
jgi:hypothetical protein